MAPLWRGRLRRTLILLADPIVAALLIGFLLAAYIEVFVP